MSSGDASWIAQLNVSELREQLAGFGLAIAGPKHELADRLRTCLYSTASSSTADRRVCSPTPLVEASRRSPRSTPRRRAQRDVTQAVMDVDGTWNLANLPAFPVPPAVPDSQETEFSFGAPDGTCPDTAVVKAFYVPVPSARMPLWLSRHSVI